LKHICNVLISVVLPYSNESVVKSVVGHQMALEQVLLAQVTTPRIDFSVWVRGKPAIASAVVSLPVAVLYLDALALTGTLMDD
jgi:hypothetical protein